MIGLITACRTPVKINAKSTNIPYCSIQKYAGRADRGKKIDNTLDPSNGGIGIRLKTANPTFMKSIVYRKRTKVPIIGRLKIIGEKNGIR